jgi:uncharacterized protein (DUF849 family)
MLQETILIDKPLLIAVAPNGARRTHADHPQLPITPGELAHTAAKCYEAGAAMLHLHVRDEVGGHSLDAQRYRRAIKEIESAVGEEMLIQVTSEAAGVYQSHEQMAAIRELAPRCVSIGLREIIADETAIEAGARFLSELRDRACLVQYILYSIEDIHWYQGLCTEGIIPTSGNLVLLVLGRYGKQSYQDCDLRSFREALTQPDNWMVCAFGAQEHQVMSQAIQLGGHVRVGFENNLWLPDGSLAADNADLVALSALSAREQGRTLATIDDAVGLFGR